MSKAVEKGITVKFDKSRCVICDTNRNIITVAAKAGDLYHINTAPVEVHSMMAHHSSFSKEDLWQQRYDHLSMKSLRKLARNDLVKDFDNSASKRIQFCESCLEGKQCRSLFPSHSESCSKEVLNLVHSDVCRKINAKSLSGAEYVLTLIDDQTRYAWVYVLKHKDEVFNKFHEWKVMVEKSTGKKLKVHRTDNGGEFTSREFGEFLKEESIKHELTVLKCPQQNGVAESLNLTLMEIVRSMLAGFKLPQTFWAEALATAMYLCNQCPTKAVQDKTPFEALTGKKPNVRHLQVFGCAAYCHIAKDEQQKLDLKSRKCIWIGYGDNHKGYWLYDV